MKSRLLIAAALCAIAFNANAQTEKGKSFINGSIGYTTNKSNAQSNQNDVANKNGTKVNNFTITPSFGHFFSNNLAIGLGLRYNNSKATTNSSGFNDNFSNSHIRTDKSESFNIDPFVRYYIDITQEFKFFGQFNASIGFGNGNMSGNSTYYDLNNVNAPIQSLDYEENYKSTIYGASINPGFAFFPSKRWAIEFSFPLVNYSKTKPKEDNLYIQETENFSFATSSFNPTIGVNFHF